MTVKTLRLIGDVHGDFSALSECIEENPQFDGLVFLGDLINHGTQSAACLKLALDLFESRRAIILRGNHEKMLYAAIKCGDVQNYPPLKATMNQFEEPGNAHVAQRFIYLYDTFLYWLRIGHVLCVHGAYHPEMLVHRYPNEIEDPRISHTVESLALYGQGEFGLGQYDLRPRRYEWTKQVPRGIKVFVGHDVLSRERPYRYMNDLGGQVVFVDTGCGKGGKLSWLDIKLTMEEFGRYYVRRF